MRAARRLRLQVGALFAAIALVVIAVNVIVMLAVLPQIGRIEQIYGGLGDRLQLLSHMRSSALSLRFIAMGAVHRASQGDGRAGEEAGAELVEQLGVLERLAAEYSLKVAAPTEAWSTLRERELPLLATRAAGVIENVRARGNAPGADIEDLRAQSIRVDHLFAELARIRVGLIGFCGRLTKGVYGVRHGRGEEAAAAA